MSFCNEIRGVRKSKGLTQQELAEEIGVVRSTIIAWEKGRYVPNQEQLAGLERALGFPLGHLYRLIYGNPTTRG